MLPPFLLPVTLDGQAKEMVAVDLPVWAFYWGYDPERMTDEWLACLLMQAVVKPGLSPELVARLGESVTEPAIAYLHAVGHIDTEDVTRMAEGGWQVGRAAQVGSLRLSVLLEATPPVSVRVGVPLDAIRGPAHTETAKLICAVAERCHVPPHVVWQTWTISDFYLTSRMLQASAAER